MNLIAIDQLRKSPRLCSMRTFQSRDGFCMTKSCLVFRELRFELRDSVQESLVISEMRP